MLITAVIYVLGLFSVLGGVSLVVSGILSLIFILLIIKEYLPLKYIIVWTLIFYTGILNTTCRLKDNDELLNLAPVNSTITGTIISIPQGINENKPKFFFKTDEIKFGSVEKKFKNEKVFATVNSFPDKPVSFDGLKLYNSLEMKGRLSTPFKAGNPSQFDYGNYLRNYDTYAVFYAKDLKPLDKKLSLKAKFMQGVNNYREAVLRVHSKYLPSPNLEILGVLLTMYDRRYAMTRDVEENVRATFGDKAFKTVVPRNVRVAEAPSHGKPALFYDFNSTGAQAYLRVATEVVQKLAKGE